MFARHTVFLKNNCPTSKGTWGIYYVYMLVHVCLLLFRSEFYTPNTYFLCTCFLFTCIIIQNLIHFWINLPYGTPKGKIRPKIRTLLVSVCLNLIKTILASTFPTLIFAKIFIYRMSVGCILWYNNWNTGNAIFTSHTSQYLR